MKIDPDEENFYIFKTINEMFRHIKQSSDQLTKKGLIDKISMRLLGLDFKLDNTKKSKAIKYVVKIFLSNTVHLSDFISCKNNENVLCQL